MKKNLEIIFVRHGESYGNISSDNPDYHSEDPSLTEEGLRQSELLSKRFERGYIDRLFASPLMRAVQTARPTAEKLDLKIQLVPDLVEVGTKFSGTDFELLKRETPLVVSCDRYLSAESESGTETTAQSFARAQRCLDYLFSVSKDNERIMVVSHGTFLGYLIRCALGLGAEPTFRLQEDNSAITHIAFFADDTPKLKYANDTLHLR
ncbi:MAG: histidine phosphatase family protein [Oscillospiraceae bacterium]|nr:histidine phosphatase family protein [Oscillospiraceae bacterium]